MRIGRAVATGLTAAVLVVSTAFAQRGPVTGTSTLRLEKATPATLTVSSDPVDVALGGAGFVSKATVRIRKAGDRGNGIDYTLTVESATNGRVRVPAEFLTGPGSIELRVKNPDGTTSEWLTLEVRPPNLPDAGDIGSRKPVVERVSPETLEANSRNLHMTFYGRDLADGAVAEFRSGNTKAQSRGSIVNRALVVPVPDEILTRPQAMIVQIRNPGGGLSDPIQFDVVAATPRPSPGDQTDPFIAQIDPQRADMRNNSAQRIEIIARGADPKGAKVLLRGEGSSESGKLIPVIERSTATNGTFIAVQITPPMVRETGAYELRVVNPNGRQSNWVRIEIVNADPGVGNTGASVDAKFPDSLTLTPVTTTVPVELTIRNSGRLPVRVSEFKLVTSDGTRTSAPGSIDVQPGDSSPLRLEAPAPLPTTSGVSRLEVALEYKLTLVSSRNPSFDGRTPSDGFRTVTVRNEIGLVDVGREYVRAQTANAPEGWRFFKADNASNVGSGQSADFYLFAEPFAAKDRLPTAELYNYRPDDSAPNDRGLFYLVLRNNEISALDARSRERGTRLGFVVAESAPGLVALYRWELSDGRRVVNHYITTEKDLAKLPRQMQNGKWKLDTIVGYVPARQP